jgi:O-antigen/teichoic acid export membrane protein
MSIVRNTAWNVMGVIVPTLFAIPSLAIYSRSLGVELLGLLTLTFSIVGYASSFDFGLSRALIRQVSIHGADVGAVKAFVGTTTVFVGVVSLVLALMTWFASPWLAGYLSISPAHRDDAIVAFYWLSLSVPPYLLSLVATAYFEGKEDFKALTILRCASSGLNAITGVACVVWIPTLSSVMAALCASRWVSCIVTFVLYRNHVNRHDSVKRPALWIFDPQALRSSLAYGGWLTISNIIGPVMSYFDRFVLSHLAGARIVAFYTVPAEVVSRLLLFPAAISKALFPRLSKRLHSAADDRRIGLMLTLTCAALIILPVFVFASDILTIWMGPDYAGEPATVLRVLLVGFFFNSLAFGPFTDLQARGYSRTTALIHVCEVLPYLGILFLLTEKYGILGTALAWSLRTFVDFLLMEALSRYHAEPATPPETMLARARAR